MLVYIKNERDTYKIMDVPFLLVLTVITIHPKPMARFTKDSHGCAIDLFSTGIRNATQKPLNSELWT